MLVCTSLSRTDEIYVMCLKKEFLKETLKCGCLTFLAWYNLLAFFFELFVEVDFKEKTVPGDKSVFNMICREVGQSLESVSQFD